MTADVHTKKNHRLSVPHQILLLSLKIAVLESVVVREGVVLERRPCIVVAVADYFVCFWWRQKNCCPCPWRYHCRLCHSTAVGPALRHFSFVAAVPGRFAASGISPNCTFLAIFGRPVVSNAPRTSRSLATSVANRSHFSAAAVVGFADERNHHHHQN